MSDLNALLDVWREINALKKRIVELERDDGAPSSVGLRDGVTAPSTITGQAQIYVDTADGDLKVKFGDGVTKTLATDT